MKKNNIIYGSNPINNIIKVNHNIIKKIFIFKENDKIREIIKIAKKLNIQVIFNKSNKLKKIINNDIVCEIKQPFIRKEPYLKKLIKDINNITILILNKINDPHNLGACIRTAEATNINAIIIQKNNSAKISPIVSNVSIGCTTIIPIIIVNSLKETIIFLKKNNISIVGSSNKGNLSIYNSNLSYPIALIIGSESKGIDNNIMKYCDSIVKIPMLGTCSSLNLSVAAGLILYEIKKQNNTFK